MMKAARSVRHWMPVAFRISVRNYSDHQSVPIHGIPPESTESPAAIGGEGETDQTAVDASSGHKVSHTEI